MFIIQALLEVGGAGVTGGGVKYLQELGGGGQLKEFLYCYV